MVELSPPRRVVYVVSRFPWLSTTFIANEMTAIASEGVEVFVAPVWKTPAHHLPQELEKPFLTKIVCPRWLQTETWLKLLKGLLRRPRVLLLILQLIPGHLKSYYLPLKLLAAIPRGLYLGEWCVEHEIDHLHAHFLSSPTTVALIASKVSGIPYSYTAHAHDITSHHPWNVSGSIRVKTRHAALGITVSHFNSHYIRAHWPEMKKARLEVLYNGIDTEMFKANGHHHSPHGDPWRVLSVSRLVPIKGCEYLIQAVAQIHHQGVNIRLDIYGDGDRRRQLEGLIVKLGASHYITLHGAVLQEVLVREFQCADIFALASVPLPWGDADGLPTVLIEALANELPTVSTQVTGIPEIIQDGITGLCVPPGDIQQLANAILWMIQHPEEARQMGQQGRQLVLAQFDRHQNAHRLLTCWREIHAVYG